MVAQYPLGEERFAVSGAGNRLPPGDTAPPIDHKLKEVISKFVISDEAVGIATQS